MADEDLAKRLAELTHALNRLMDAKAERHTICPVPCAEEPRESDGLMTVEEAARYIGMSTSWLEKETAAGRAPIRVYGRCVRYDRAELLAWGKKGGG